MTDRIYHAMRDTITIKSIAPSEAYVLFEVANPQDSGPPPHMHHWDEVMYVLEGTVDVMVDGNVTTANAGSTVSVPAGTLHNFKGRGPSGSRFLVFASPAGIERFFEELDREIGVPKGPPDVGKVKAISERHGYRWPQG